jgi:hypothetical protein
MNWFGLFTMAFGVLLIAVIFAIEYGYEQCEKDMHLSKEWIARQEMEMKNWSSPEAQQFLRSRSNHPTNGDWK